MKIINLGQIKEALKQIDIIAAMERGFVAYSNGNAIVPPIGELLFKNPPGDVHIKYGYIVGDEYYIIKVASGFYENPALNLSSSNGLMLLFSQKTGAILGILLDEGYLTDLRTAAAGAVAAKYLAPSKVERIGIIGTGIQARLQLTYLQKTIDCKDILIWGRNLEKLLRFKNDINDKEFCVQTTKEIEDITTTCNLIVTTTPSTHPLLWENQIKKGTHITAVGADSPHKQELDKNIFLKADIIVADSVTQCMERGDISHAIKNNIISKGHLQELGHVISGANPKRTSDHQITIADLTGLAVQDIEIAKAVYNSQTG